MSAAQGFLNAISNNWSVRCLHISTMLSQIRILRRPVCTSSDYNPLFEQDHLPQFKKIEPRHVAFAIQSLTEEFTQNFQTFESQIQEKLEEDVNWQSVIEPIEKLNSELKYAWSTVTHLNGVRNSEELRNAYQEVQPLVVKSSTLVSQSKPFYSALQKLTQKSSELDEGQQRIITSFLRASRNGGVGLQGKEKERFNQIQLKLAQLGTQFSNNVLDAIKQFSIMVTDWEHMQGLPESLLQLTAMAAATDYNRSEVDPKKGPWKLTLDLPCYQPFMQYSENRELRERLYKAYITKASTGKTDNSNIIEEMRSLRAEKASLLGFKNHASLSLESKMAGYPEEVWKLITELKDKSKNSAIREMDQLKAFASNNGFRGDIQLWDIPYWAEKQRQRLFSFNDEQLRPYFPLERVLTGLFKFTTELLGVTIKSADGEADVWHKDVRFFNIFSEKGEHVASFFLDPYSRPEEKRGGAWMDQCTGKSGLMNKIPVAYLVCNQSPPRDKTPSLMTFREVETLFHEFGHGLQHMLTTVPYTDAAGIDNVEWDAVELPSQFMENWMYDKTTVDVVSGHYETRQTLPADLFKQIGKDKEMDNYSAAREPQWIEDTLRTITFLQYQMAQLDDCEVPSQATNRDRYGHALACVLRHYRCRTQHRPENITTSEVCAQEFARLTALSRSREVTSSDQEVQTENEQKAEQRVAQTQTTPPVLTVPLVSINVVGRPPPREYYEGIDFAKWEPLSAISPPGAPPPPYSRDPPPSPKVTSRVLVEESPSKDGEVVEVTSEKSKAGKVEKKNLCSVCKKEVFRIRRHLSRTHSLSGQQLEDARAASRAVLMDKKREENPVGTKRNPVRRCPVDGCGVILTRLDRHLAREHDISKSTDPERYKALHAQAPLRTTLQEPARVQEESVKVEEKSASVQEKSACTKARVQKMPTKKKRRGKKRPLSSSSESSEDTYCSWSDVDDSSDYYETPEYDYEYEDGEVDDEVLEEILPPPSKGKGKAPLPRDVTITGLLGRYMQFRQTPHGGDMDAKQAKEDVSKVKIIADTICKKEGATLMDCFSDPDLVWNAFFKPNREGIKKAKSGTTLKVYSRSLENFLGWLLDHQLTFLTVKETSCVTLLKTLQLAWRRSLRKDCAKQRNKQRTEDKKNQLTLEEVKAILESNHGKRARRRMMDIAKNKSAPGVTSKDEARQMEEYVVSWLAVVFAARASLIANCLLEDYQQAREQGEMDGCYELTVMDHKTSQTHGPLTVYLDEDTMKLLVVYKRYARPLLLKGGSCEYLFVDVKGQKIESSRVHCVMKRFLNSTEIKLQPGKTFKCTTVRKMWVTHLKSKGATDEQLRDLATLMKHSRKVQEAWYDLSLKSLGCKRACVAIGKELSEAQARLPTFPVPATPSPKKSLKETTKEIEDKDSEPCESPHRKYHGKRYPWSAADEDTLKKGMAKLLSNNKFPKATEITKFYVDGPIKVQNIWNRYDCSDWRAKCVEKIRNMYKHQKK